MKNRNHWLWVLACCCFMPAWVHAQLATHQKRGFFNITQPLEVHWMRAIDTAFLDNGSALMRGGIEFNTINGYFFSPAFSGGLGVGLQYSKYKFLAATDMENISIKPGMPNALFLPIFLDFRYYPQNKISGSAFLVNAGYAPLLSIKNKSHREDIMGGPFVKLGFSYKMYMNEWVAFVPSINFKAQRFGEATAVGITAAIGFLF